VFEQELLETAEELGDVSTVHFRPSLPPVNPATDDVTFQQFDIVEMPGIVAAEDEVDAFVNIIGFTTNVVFSFGFWVNH
jgi:hypothetical protein